MSFNMFHASSKISSVWVWLGFLCLVVMDMKIHAVWGFTMSVMLAQEFVGQNMIGVN